MNRNSEAHFSKAPIVDIPRSKFDKSFTHKTTFDSALLVPIYWSDVMPGDTVSMKTSELIRMTTPITPVMDNAFADIYFFYVPNRIINETWVNFMGENTTGPWVEDKEYHVPQTYSPKDWLSDPNVVEQDCGWKVGSLANYLGLPLNYNTPAYDPETGQGTKESFLPYHVQSHPFRAYCLIWNEWFRSTPLQTPCYITMDDSDTKGRNWDYTPAGRSTGENLLSSWVTDYVQYAETGAWLLPVCKPHDYFTSCLPQPQFGDDIHVPMSIGEDDLKAPVKIGLNKDFGTSKYGNLNATLGDIKTESYLLSFLEKSSGGAYTQHLEGLNYPSTNNMVIGNVVLPNVFDISSMQNNSVIYNEYYADLSNALGNAVGATVNQIRQAFAIQRFYERVAEGGQRYIEQIYSHFHVTNPDYRMQRPEYLGGKRIPISMSQILATTGTEGQPLGDTGGWSVTSDSNSDLFTHSFTEHGIIMGLVCVRNSLSYQQGINRMWLRENLFDYYFPEFATLGAQPVYNKELMVTGNDDDGVFGYNEAWAFERYMPDIITGEMNSVYPQSLDIWHYGDYYDPADWYDPETLKPHAPYLSEKWIEADKTNINRTLAIQNQHQFKADFYFNAIWTRPMPLYSVPGLVDHH